VLKGLKRAPAGVKALPTILSSYVALSERDMRRQSLAARDPLLRDVLAAVDRHAATAPLTAPAPRARPQLPPAGAARQDGDGVPNPVQPMRRAAAVQPGAAAAASQQQPAAGSDPPAAMRMVPSPASAVISTSTDVVSPAAARVSTLQRPSDMRPGRAAGAASPWHGSRKRLPARRKRPASEELDAAGQDGGMADALGILERSLNPETLLSLFSGGELQVRRGPDCHPGCHNATCSAADSIVYAVQSACIVSRSRWVATFQVMHRSAGALCSGACQPLVTLAACAKGRCRAVSATASAAAPGGPARQPEQPANCQCQRVWRQHVRLHGRRLCARCEQRWHS
jgi:hypothetical protein